MARTPSNMLPLGTQAPSFSLLNTVDDSVFSFNKLEQKATVVMFICNHCPFVIHLHKGLQSLVSDYKDKEVSFVAINSNDVENYPDDRPELMKVLFDDLGFDFPYLYDETQSVAKAYDAACTPDFYIFDSEMKLAYRGQFDASRPGNNIAVTGFN